LSFSVEGRLRENVLKMPGRQKVKWNKGDLEGEPDLVAWIKMKAGFLGTYGYVVGPVRTHDHLASGVIALKFLVEEIFDNPEITGRIPRLPPTPDGVVN
jgi:hypothetical protein